MPEQELAPELQSVVTILPKTEIQSVVIVCRKWFRSKDGNTYYSAEVVVDGVQLHFIEFAYGYDDTYEHRAWKWIDDNVPLLHKRQLSDGGHVEDPWRYCKRVGVAYHPTVAWVGRKKDL